MKITVGSRWKFNNKATDKYQNLITHVNIITKVENNIVYYNMTDKGSYFGSSKTEIDSFLRDLEPCQNSRILELDFKIKKIKAAL